MTRHFGESAWNGLLDVPAPLQGHVTYEDMIAFWPQEEQGHVYTMNIESGPLLEFHICRTFAVANPGTEPVQKSTANPGTKPVQKSSLYA